MPHIAIPPGIPGISGLFAAVPETARPLRELAEVLLRGPSPLTAGERETIAAFVSDGNECAFCAASHSAAAAELTSEALVSAVKRDYEGAPLSPKMKALLAIAEKVRVDGRTVEAADVEAARGHGAGDRDIHDTVLIAAAFSMFNRYVDGLATWSPTDPAIYKQIGQKIASEGYLRPMKTLS